MNSKLSKREKQILILVGQGYSNRKMAAMLGKSQRTMETHREHIIKKLGANNMCQAITIALRKRMVKVKDFNPIPF